VSDRPFTRFCRRSTGLVFVAGLLPLQFAIGAEWTITPSVTVAETYTDNVELAPSGQEEDEFITEVNPGISLRGEGRRMTVQADYRMQNLFYAKDSDDNETNHQLRALAEAELIEDSVFVDATSSVSQELISNEDSFGADNLNILDNRTDVVTYSVSPYYRNDFGGNADLLARYTRSGVRFDEGASDSDTDEIDLTLGSGRRFTELTWDVTYHNEQTDRTSTSQLFGGDVDRESALGELGYRLSANFSLLAQVGYENNDFETNRDLEDGTYWGVGGAWRPNQRFTAQALFGEDFTSANLNWNPTRRTTLQLGWRDRDVGDNPGEVWTGLASVRTRRTIWQARYAEDSQTTQELQTFEPVFLNLNPDTGELFPEPIPGQTIPIRVERLPDLRNEVFLRKRGEASVVVLTGRSTLRFAVFQETREFEISGDDERSRGTNASWNWRFATRTSSILSTGWETIEFRPDENSIDREDDLWFVDASLVNQTRSSGRRLLTSVGYRYTSRDSNEPGRDYDENRVFVSATMFLGRGR
jgi:uncharacterized protein (PEP-CTERM system associated)